MVDFGVNILENHTMSDQPKTTVVADAHNAEWEKYKRSQEKVREYFDLLAIERDSRNVRETELICERDYFKKELAAERKKVSDRHKLCVDYETKWKAEREKSRILGNMTDGFRNQLAAALKKIDELTNKS